MRRPRLGLRATPRSAGDSASCRSADEEKFAVTSVISLPNGQSVSGVDTSFVDPVAGVYALAHYGNKSVDIVDTASNRIKLVDDRGSRAGRAGTGKGLTGLAVLFSSRRHRRAR